MDTGFSSNMGFVVMGALWALYVIGTRISQDRTDKQRQAKHDESVTSLLAALNAAVSRGEDSVNKERLRNAELHSTQVAQARELGEAKGLLEFERKLREHAEMERDAAREALKSLAIEQTNLRRSNDELVKFNKDLLRSYSVPSQKEVV